MIFNGSVRRIFPGGLIEQLSKQARAFVETGTYQGSVTRWAAQRFDRVITVEGSEQIYERTTRDLQYLPNVDFRFGNSPNVLANVLKGLDGPLVFWLDAHWCSGALYPKDCECPLMQELAVIKRHPGKRFIFIDDARLFVSPVPSPLQPTQWPTIFQIAAMFPGSYVTVINDVLLIAPKESQVAVDQYARRLRPARLENRPELLRNTGRFYLWLRKLKNR
jgi:hypothetical protein